jgi:hypothetical protein
VLPLPPGGQTDVYHTTGDCMLTHLPQLCNVFSLGVAGGICRLVHAQPLRSRPQPACSPGRPPPMSVPVPARAPRHLHGPRNAARSCAHVVDPTGCQRVPSSRPALDVKRSFESPRVWRGRERSSLVPTGEVPSYLLEKFPRTYWRSSLVPTGEVPRTYWRSPSYLLETKYGLSRCYQKQCAL